jgi:hypothetical protein
MSSIKESRMDSIDNNHTATKTTTIATNTRNSENDSGSSMSSENEVSYEEEEMFRPSRGVSHQQHTTHAHNHHFPQGQIFKNKNFIIDQQASTMMPPAQPLSVRYYIAPATPPAHNPNQNVMMIPPQHKQQQPFNYGVFEKFAYSKPKNIAYQPQPQSYSGVASYQPNSANFQYSHQNLNMMMNPGSISYLENQNEYMRYVQQQQHQHQHQHQHQSRLIKGELAHAYSTQSIQRGLNNPPPLISQTPSDAPTNPNFQYMPSNIYGGSQFSLNYPVNMMNPNFNPSFSYYPPASYKIMQQNNPPPIGPLKQGGQAKEKNQQQMQSESEAEIDDSSLSSSTHDENQQKDEETNEKKAALSQSSSRTDIVKKSNSAMKLNGNIKNTSSATFKQAKISKPVSANWLMAGAAGNNNSGIGSSNSSSINMPSKRTFFRSPNGYYDDSLNDRTLFNGMKEESQFKKYFKICGITLFASFLVIAIILAVFFVLFYAKRNYIKFNFRISEKKSFNKN